MPSASGYFFQAGIVPVPKQPKKTSLTSRYSDLEYSVRREVLMQSGPLRALLLAVLFSSSTAFAQKPAVSPRVTAAIDEAKLTVLKGNTHPLARAEFDRGAAPANHRLNRMLLVLRRGAEQEQGLHKLLD